MSGRRFTVANDLPEFTAELRAKLWDEAHVALGEMRPAARWFGMERNPSRRWWQLWKPRWVTLDELQLFQFTQGE